MGCSDENLFKCSESHDQDGFQAHMWQNLKNSSCSEPRGRWPWNLVYSIEYSSTTKFVQMMTLVWPWPFLWHGQICFLVLLPGWKLIQHIVMYFRGCSNSAYPMHSGEQYWTIGPLFFSSPEPLDSLVSLKYSHGSSSLHPLSVRPPFSKIFFSKTAGPIKAKFIMEPQWDGETKVFLSGLGHMTKMAAPPIYGKNPSKIFFSRTKGPMILWLGM